MKTKRIYYNSTMFSGEVILSDNKFDTYEEADKNRNKVYPDIDWVEYLVHRNGNVGLVVATSYD